jgi:chloramphenicol 3-O-phosphotransferase
MRIVVLTGPPGSGKSTLAHALARVRGECAVIEVDDVRQMLVHPHAAQWDGPEGHRQRLLGVGNASALAQNFHAAGCDVLIADVLTDDTATLYRTALAPLDVTVVRLVVDWTEGHRRAAHRDYTLQPPEMAWLYEEAEALTDFDQELNTGGSLEETVLRLGQLLGVTAGLA